MWYGRILIQVGKTNQFKTYRPDSDENKGILNNDMGKLD